MKKVFLSSPVVGLEEYRQAARETIDRLDGYRCVSMEDFGARDSSPAELCRSKVQESDVFVGILGPRYGSCPPDENRSYSELEYEAAGEAKIPRLMFAAPEEMLIPHNLIEPDELRERQRALRSRALNERVTCVFDSPDSLGGGVAIAFHNLQTAINTTLRHKRDELVARRLIMPSVVQVTLLFPFVSNQAGLDTGIVISNISRNPFGDPESYGRFTIYYYGTGLANGRSPAPQTSIGTVGPGEQAIFSLNSAGSYGLSPTPGFRGYLIAVCNFPAHGVVAVYPIDDALHASFYPATVLTEEHMLQNADAIIL